MNQMLSDTTSTISETTDAAVHAESPGVPPGVTDVQEYLVAGVPRERQWVG